MIKLDQKDRKILAILSIDARATYSKIAKQTKLSKDVVAYRLRKLEENKVISGYTAFFDFSLLGNRVYKFYIKFRGLNEVKKGEIFKFLKEEKKVGWIVEGNGNWDMILGVQTSEVSDFYEFKLDFEKRFSNNIISSSVTTQIQAYFYPRNYLINLESGGVVLYSGKKQLTLDKNDHKILQELAKDSRATVIDISKKTNLSIRTVAYRIKQLEKTKVILLYRASLNLEKIGYIFIKSFIKLQDVSIDKKKEIISFFKNTGKVIHNVESLGEWELEPEFEVENIEEFYSIINQFRSEYYKNVARIDSMIINREYKYSYVP